MGKIYSTQDYLRIELQYEEELTDAVTSAKIKYIDPNDVAGEWVAVHNDTTKTVYYDVPIGEPLNIVGKWIIWSYLTMSDGRVLPGSPCSINIYDEGGSSSGDGCITGNCY